MEETKRKRGRPVNGQKKTRRIDIRVSEEFYNEFLKLCELDGETQTEYVIKSINAMGNLTRYKASEESKNDPGDDIFDQWYDEEEENYDE